MDDKKDVGPQIRRRESWVELPQEYEGFKVRIWVNAPTRVWNELTGGDEEETQAALREIVLEHNGWRDFEGNAYPPARDQKFWEEIPTELAACILMAAQAEIQRLPNSIAPQARRSRRG